MDDEGPVNYITTYQHLYDQVYDSNYDSVSDNNVAAISCDSANPLELLNAKINFEASRPTQSLIQVVWSASSLSRWQTRSSKLHNLQKGLLQRRQRPENFFKWTNKCASTTHNHGDMQWLDSQWGLINSCGGWKHANHWKRPLQQPGPGSGSTKSKKW